MRQCFSIFISVLWLWFSEILNEFCEIIWKPQQISLTSSYSPFYKIVYCWEKRAMCKGDTLNRIFFLSFFWLLNKMYFHCLYLTNFIKFMFNNRISFSLKILTKGLTITTITGGLLLDEYLISSGQIKKNSSSYQFITQFMYFIGHFVCECEWSIIISRMC